MRLRRLSDKKALDASRQAQSVARADTDRAQLTIIEIIDFNTDSYDMILMHNMKANAARFT